MTEPVTSSILERVLEERDRRYLERFAALSERIADTRVWVQQGFDGREKLVEAIVAANAKAVDKAEVAQAARNDQQNEFRKSLSDLSGLMWTIKEGTAAVEALRREMLALISALDTRTQRLDNAISIQLGSAKKSESTTTTFIAIAAVVIALFIGLLGVLRPLPAPAAGQEPKAAAEERRSPPP